MSDYSIPEAARQLLDQWAIARHNQLREFLVDQGLIVRDTAGHYKTTPRADSRYLITVHGYHPAPLPGNPYHQQPHATVHITDAGLQWLHDVFTRQDVA